MHYIITRSNPGSIILRWPGIYPATGRPKLPPGEPASGASPRLGSKQHSRSIVAIILLSVVPDSIISHQMRTRRTKFSKFIYLIKIRSADRCFPILQLQSTTCWKFFLTNSGDGCQFLQFISLSSAQCFCLS